MGDVPYNGSNPTPGVDAIPPGVTPVPGTGQVPGEQDTSVGGSVLPQPEAAAADPPPPEAPAPGEDTVTVTSRFGVQRTYPRSQWEQIKDSLYIRIGGWTETPAGAPPVQPRPEYQPTVPLNRPGVAPQAAPAPPWNPETDPMPTSDAAVSKVLPTEWQALQGVMPQPMAPQPQQQAIPQMGGEPVAVRRARIAASPPWRLSEDDLMWAEQNGLDSEAWAIPGRGAA